MLINREAQKKKASTASKAGGEVVGCIGRIELSKQPYHTKTGSGYVMFFMDLVPDDSTDGIQASYNLMIHPDWLQSDFDPTKYDISLMASERAKSRIKRAKKEGVTPDPEDVTLVTLSKQAFVYQANVFNEKGTSTLQTLLGEAFDEFIDELTAESSEQFLKDLRAMYSRDDVTGLFLYECSQQKDKDGDLMQQMSVTDFVRVGKIEDIEEWASEKKTKGVDITFDPSAFELDSDE